MANSFSVTVGQTANNKITVNAGQSTADILLSKDLSVYYSQLAKEWAVRIGSPVEGESYSAKHYAKIAQDIADQFGISKDEVIMVLQSEGMLQISKIQEVADPILKEIDNITPVADNITDVVNISNNLDDILNKTVDVGQTITGEEGTLAKVENVGTQFAPVLDFTIPKGDKGDDGGMDATYDDATGTLSFYKETGTVLSPKWGKISGDITKQYDLANTYATKTYVAQMITSLAQFKLSIVNSLPAFGEKMMLYLVPRTGGDFTNAYDEYIWIDEISMFEHLGSTAVDLTDYATKAEIGDIASILDEINGEIV